jgi:hypothetical protein
MMITFENAAVTKGTVVASRRPMCMANATEVPAARRIVDPNAVVEKRLESSYLFPVRVNLKDKETMKK